MSTIYVSAEGASAIQRRYEGFLQHWPAPNRTVRVPTRHGETFVVASGPADAPPVVLLHGAVANSMVWLADAAVWSADLRIYAVDVIGEPGLSAPARPPLASDAYAGWLDDVLDGLGVSKASFVGVSLGGWLALDYATRRPERVDRLALLCPGGIGRQKYAAILAAALVQPFGAAGIRAAFRIVTGEHLPSGTPLADELGDYLVLINRQFRPRRDRLPVFGDDDLSRLRAPALVILGGRDRILDSHDTRRRLERNAPGVTVRFLPEAGHLLREQAGPIHEFLVPAPHQ